MKQENIKEEKDGFELRYHQYKTKCTLNAVEILQKEYLKILDKQQKEIK